MNYRVCIVKTVDGERKALFHHFVKMTARTGREDKDIIRAIVEFEDGSIAVTSHRNIKFINSKAMCNVAEMGEEIFKNIDETEVIKGIK